MLKIVSSVVAGIDTKDYPDFVDAYIESAEVEDGDGTVREATEAELDQINQDAQYVYERVLAKLF